jgi:hypothetical protein
VIEAYETGVTMAALAKQYDSKRWLSRGSSLDGEGKEGIDRSFQGTGAPLHLGE